MKFEYDSTIREQYFLLTIFLNELVMYFIHKLTIVENIFVNKLFIIDVIIDFNYYNIKSNYYYHLINILHSFKFN